MTARPRKAGDDAIPNEQQEYETDELRQVDRLVYVASMACIPTALACSAVYYAITREWAQGFLPDEFIVLLPFHVSAVLSTGFVCVLAAVWVCWRKSPAAESSAAEPVE